MKSHMDGTTNKRYLRSDKLITREKYDCVVEITDEILDYIQSSPILSEQLIVP
jgi:hypothetical protein